MLTMPTLLARPNVVMVPMMPMLAMPPMLMPPKLKILPPRTVGLDGLMPLTQTEVRHLYQNTWSIRVYNLFLQNLRPISFGSTLSLTNTMINRRPLLPQGM